MANRPSGAECSSLSIAPAIGGAMILSAASLAVSNYEMMTGVKSAVINCLPWALPIVALFGFLQAQWLRLKRPDIYHDIGKTRIDKDE